MHFKEPFEITGLKIEGEVNVHKHGKILTVANLVIAFMGTAQAQDYSAQDDECVYKTGRVQSAKPAQAVATSSSGTKLRGNICEVGTRAETEAELACEEGKKFAKESKSDSYVLSKCERYSYDTDLKNSCVMCGSEIVNAYWKRIRESRRTSSDSPRNPRL